jgi:hypothetical protein
LLTEELLIEDVGGGMREEDEFEVKGWGTEQIGTTRFFIITTGELFRSKEELVIFLGVVDFIVFSLSLSFDLPFIPLLTLETA